MSEEQTKVSIDSSGEITAHTPSYRFHWSRAADTFELFDSSGRMMVSGPMQPAVTIRDGSGPASYQVGTVQAAVVDDDALRVTYHEVNGDGSLVVSWRFDDECCWLEPVTYTPGDPGRVVALHYFAVPGESAASPDPGLSCRYVVHPGVCGAGVVSPLIPALANFDTETWLGRGGPGTTAMRQQWGLPVHYVAGVNTTRHTVEPGAHTRNLSDAFCLGLAELPAGDLLLRNRAGRFAPVVQVRDDLWRRDSPAGPQQLGALMVWTLGPTYRAAVLAYQQVLVATGRVTPTVASTARAHAATVSQFNTWGAQIASGTASREFDEASLATIRKQLGDSGLDTGMLVIDDKWEGEYGVLEHDVERFPTFEEALQDIRAGGQLVGLWAAFLRCEDPTSHGLSANHMMCGPDGEPVVLGPEGQPYFLFDVSWPEVQTVLRDRIAAFVHRYDPDLVKFDFGYEIPDLSRCAPHDPAYAGERLFALAMDVVAGALRAAKPDIVVMYYSLSPLLAPYYDLHSLDDLWMNAGEFHLEANRRLFFSGLLGELGVASYGSGGYDWVDMADIWLDSVVHGTLGALGSFFGDLSDSACTPRLVAKHTGLSRLTRPRLTFGVQAIGAGGLGPASAARSSSWVRTEDGEPVLVVLRPGGFAGAPGVDEVEGLVRSTVTVAVGSLQPGGIGPATHLGVVAYADGEVWLTGRSGAARVTEHRLDGSSHDYTVDSADGSIRLPVRESAEGTPVSWLEVVVDQS